MEIHIGSIIKRVVTDKRILMQDFAEQINIPAGSLSRLFRKQAIPSDLLYKISDVLKYDFFAIYSGHLNIKKVEVTPLESEKILTEKMLADKNVECEGLKKEIFYLTQINNLLMKK